jgi:hypothetical protein
VNVYALLLDRSASSGKFHIRSAKSLRSPSPALPRVVKSAMIFYPQRSNLAAHTTREVRQRYGDKENETFSGNILEHNSLNLIIKTTIGGWFLRERNAHGM